MEAAPQVPVRDIFRRFWPDTHGLRGWMVLGLGLVSLASLASGADIWLFKILIDNVLTPRDFRVFPKLAAAYVGITLAGGVVSFTNQYLAAWVGETFLFRLRNRVFAHLHSLSVSYFDRSRLGDVLSRLGGDVGAIENLVLSGVIQTFSTVFEFGLYTGFLFYLNWRLALLSFAVVPFFAVISRVFSRRIRTVSRESRRRGGAVVTVAEESLGNTLYIQAYGRRQHELDRFADQNTASMYATLAAARIGALFGPLTDLLQVVGVLTIVGVGVWELTANHISLGGLLVFLIYLSQLYGPVSGLSQLSSTVYGAAAAAERIIELLDQRPLVTAPAQPRRLDRVTGHLRVRAASFAYPDTAHNVLSDVSFELAPGTMTALVGGSGAGKTTLTKLLLRLYDPTGGSITLDGHDLRALDPEQLRRHIAVVLQETPLLDDTVAENILAGRTDATHEEMLDAARAADAHEFISALPSGYDTRVGQRGRLLSGGQRQRVAIARAMIRDAPILLLDEPTTGIDAAASDRILVPLRRLMAGRTTLVISHNLLTVTDADHIIYLENGRITAAGTHSQLLSTSRAYAQLYHLHHPVPRSLPGPGRPALVHTGRGRGHSGTPRSGGSARPAGAAARITAPCASVPGALLGPTGLPVAEPRSGPPAVRRVALSAGSAPPTGPDRPPVAAAAARGRGVRPRTVTLAVAVAVTMTAALALVLPGPLRLPGIGTRAPVSVTQPAVQPHRSPGPGTLTSRPPGVAARGDHEGSTRPVHAPR